MTVIHKNMSLRNALKAAKDLGLGPESLPQTGEIGVRDLQGRLIRISVNRHDVPQRLVTVLRQAERNRRS